MQENKLTPTAATLFNKMLDKDEDCSSIEMMIEFAILHVKKALQCASENAKTRMEKIPYTGERAGGYYTKEIVDADSILNSYPLSNIK